jgi:hypothetical protein
MSQIDRGAIISRMKSNAQRKLPLETLRPTYRTLEGWALGLLLEQHAIRECEEHGHIHDRADQDAWNRAREAARQSPFPGTSSEASVAALDDVNLARLLARRADGIFLAPFEQGAIGPALFSAACKLGLEGLVSKRRDSAYRAGRSSHWLKVKNPASAATTRAKAVQW